jgi:hypothetical protein
VAIRVSGVFSRCGVAEIHEACKEAAEIQLRGEHLIEKGETSYIRRKKKKKKEEEARSAKTCE